MTSRAPKLGTRGRRLWDQVTGEGELRPAERVLLEEACRVTDRLDRLDRTLDGRGEEWIRFSETVDGSEVVVIVDRALSEARQQQIALKQLLAELRQSRAAAAKPAGKATPAGKEVAGVTDLTTWTPARSPKAAG